MVLVHREVEIEPRIGDQPGQDTDLLVTVVGSNGPIHCTIEVKCSWNSEVETGLTDQLVDRYLQGSEGRTGVFLVLHFVRGPNWDESDSRRRVAFDEPEVRKLLDSQAAEAADRATVHPLILRIDLGITASPSQQDVEPRQTPAEQRT